MTKKNGHIPQQRLPLVEIFIHRNSQINLSAIRVAGDIYTKHILDSLELTKIINIEDSKKTDPNLTLLDIGTGGGFPLLPLAISYPKISCIGLDARKKKCFAIDEMVKALGLKNVRTLRARAEETKLQVDILTSRAVTYADQLFRRSLPLVKKGGLIIFYKLYTTEEDNIILTLITEQKLTLVKMHHYTLPDDEVERVIYVMKK